MTDTIADMLSRMRNAGMAHKSEVVVPHSRMRFLLAKIFEKEGYVSSVEKMEGNQKSIKLVLKYDENSTHFIKSIKKISKPGRRAYVKSTEMPVVLDGLGIAIVSTSKGLMTNRQAKAAKLGGEVICEIY